MQYVNVYSWSESLLPVLYVGAHIPHDLNRISALAHPPYTLQSGQSLWFIGPPDTKGPFTVIWRTEDRTYYASVRETSA
ncbi:hypothetical protein GCM10025857_17850 [Alicyclobacillus contaminans]|nr:hypothetical protein GCM10025857_17850 [Alicyclobacillus contaminans]